METTHGNHQEQGNGALTTAAGQQPAGTVARDEFGGQQLARVAETASSAVAAQARAAVESRYVLALRRPRDWDEVRVRILKECQRPGFADCAIYRKPIGKGVEGLSIRFAEAALRHMGNMLAETPTIYDDAEKRIIRVSVTDLESNATVQKDIVVEKVVERSSLKDGQVPLSKRTNSRGATTYLVAASEDDLLNKEGALVSKALRNAVLRLLPGDLQDEAEAAIRKTRADRAKKDPDGERRRLVDAFAAIGVGPSDLREYLGHDLDKVVPAEIDELRGVYTALKDGEVTSWAAVISEKAGRVAKASGEAAAPAPATASAKDKLKRDKAAKAAAASPEPPAEPPTPSLPGIDDDEPGADG